MKDIKGVTIRFNNDTMPITIHGWQCELDIITFFAKKRGKENTYFNAVAEEVKHLKNMIH